jgi:hypothetical protein
MRPERNSRNLASVIIQVLTDLERWYGCDPTVTYPLQMHLYSLGRSSWLSFQPHSPRNLFKPEQQQQRWAKNRSLLAALRYDRAGSAVHDMLYAHAYSFADGVEIAGACQLAPLRYETSEDDQNLLDILGLNISTADGVSWRDTRNDKCSSVVASVSNDSYLQTMVEVYTFCRAILLSQE